MAKSANVEYLINPNLKVVLAVSFYDKHDFCAHALDMNKGLVAKTSKAFWPKDIQIGTHELPIGIDTVKHVIMDGVNGIEYDAATTGPARWQQLERDIDIGAILSELPSLRTDAKTLRAKNVFLQGTVEMFQKTLEGLYPGQSILLPTAPTTTTKYKGTPTHRRIVLPTKTKENKSIYPSGTQQTKPIDTLHAIQRNMYLKQKSAQRHTQLDFQASPTLKVDILVSHFYESEFREHAVDVNKELANTVRKVIRSAKGNTEARQTPIMKVDEVVHIIVNGVEGVYYKTPATGKHQWERIEKDINIANMQREHATLKAEVNILEDANRKLQVTIDEYQAVFEKIRSGQYKPSFTKTTHQGNPTHRSTRLPAKIRGYKPTYYKPVQKTSFPTSFGVVTGNTLPIVKPTQSISEQSKKPTRSKNSKLKNIFDRAKKYFNG